MAAFAISTALALAALAMAIEAALGYPDALFRRIGHPVTWIGAAIDAVERRCNADHLSRRRRIAAGLAFALFLLLGTGGIGAGIQYGLLASLPAFLALPVLALLTSSLLAQRSLHSHVRRVHDALKASPSDLDPARKALSMIVGRQTGELDESAMAGAAIESLAENFSDGVVAPVFWTALGGLGGGLAYKAVNTADSMIGHRSDRFEAFGKAAARLDDLVNLPASRLTAGLIVIVAALDPALSARGAMRAIGRDAPSHRSINAGWPEAAMAGALDIAIGGPRIYGATEVPMAPMNASGRKVLDADDIGRALTLYRRADALLFALLAALAVFVGFVQA